MDLISETYLMDCMQGMKEYPDNYFDLAVVDPPYGINFDGETTVKGKAGKANTFNNKQHHIKKTWDSEKPLLEYWIELFRVSKNQIVWGGNYFTKHLPESRGWIYWDKKITNANNKNFSDGELAWTSFEKRLIKFTYDWIGFGYLNNPQKEKKIHPTHKPEQLYNWIYMNYSEPGQRILDTHLGSGSNRIAAHKNGLHFVGFEIDEEYYYAQEHRFKTYLSQPTLFSTPSAVGVLNTNASAQTDLWNTNSPQPL